MISRNFIAIIVGLLVEMEFHMTLTQRPSTWNDIIEDETASMAPPTFIDTPTVVTVKEGQMAKLECSLDNLGTKNVIWRRKSQPNPLTIGRRTFVDDTRIMVDHQPLDPEWPLIIKQVRKEDGGDYECQVASKDRTNRRYVKLIVKPGKKNKNRNRKKDKYKVMDPKQGDDFEVPENILPSRGITIAGRTFVENGQDIVLICNATSSESGHHLQDLDWFFEGQKLTTDINKKRNIRKRVSLMDRTIDSVLEIKSADMSNAGVYICRTSELQIESVRVDVLNAGTSNVKRRTEKDKNLNDGTKSSQRSGDSGSDTNHLVSIYTFSTCLVLSLLTTGNLKGVTHYAKWLPV